MNILVVEDEERIGSVIAQALAEQSFEVDLARDGVAGVEMARTRPSGRPAGTYVQVGRMLGDVDVLLGVVVIGSAVLVPVVLTLTGVGAFISTRRAMRPIEEIVGALETIQATSLRRRITPAAADEEIRRLANAINQLLDRLNTSFTTSKEFTADVSHQLQTPLTVMRGSLDVAKSSGAPVDYPKLCGELSVELDALTAALQDLRDYALADADSANTSGEAVNLSGVFEEAADVVRALAESHDVTCDVSIAPGLRAWGNAVRLRQVLLNLGENAVQFTPAGGRIRISARSEDRRVVLRVEDNGSGIAPELLPHVFERYVHSSRGRSGLGLAITKRIVDAHRGDMRIESVVGSGTSVTVLLPVASLEA